MLNNSVFEMKSIAVFTRDPHKSWATSTVKLDEKEIKLSKEEKNEPILMSLRLCQNELREYESTQTLVLNII